MSVDDFPDTLRRGLALAEKVVASTVAPARSVLVVNVDSRGYDDSDFFCMPLESLPHFLPRGGSQNASIICEMTKAAAAGRYPVLVQDLSRSFIVVSFDGSAGTTAPGGSA